MFGNPVAREERYCMRLSCSGIDSMQIEVGLTRLKAVLET